MMIRTLAAASLVFITGAAARGAVVASYNFNSGSAASSDTDPNSTALNVSLVDGTPHEASIGHADSGLGGSYGQIFVYAGATGSDQTAAVADDDYFTFTINAAVGKVLNLSSLTFDLGGSAPSTDGTFTDTVYVQESVDGIGSPSDVLASRTRLVGNTNGFAVLSAATPIDLTAARFQGLTSITFHFSFSDNSSNAGSIDRFDNLILNGTTAAAVVVPTPAALPAGLAMLGLAGLSRRRITTVPANRQF
jgi:hypothetical protein